MNFPHASGSREESLLTRIAQRHQQLVYKERNTERYARLTVAIRELSTAY